MAVVTDFKFSLIYAEDFEETKAFYEKYFGFKQEFEMPDTELGPQTWGKTGEVGMWIGGGYERVEVTERSCRSGVMFGVESAVELFKQLQTDSIKVLHEAPVPMQDGVFFFQFEDPSGNLIDILGRE